MIFEVKGQEVGAAFLEYSIPLKDYMAEWNTLFRPELS